MFPTLQADSQRRAGWGACDAQRRRRTRRRHGPRPPRGHPRGRSLGPPATGARHDTARRAAHALHTASPGRGARHALIRLLTGAAPGRPRESRPPAAHSYRSSTDATPSPQTSPGGGASGGAGVTRDRLAWRARRPAPGGGCSARPRSASPPRGSTSRTRSASDRGGGPASTWHSHSRPRRRCAPRPARALWSTVAGRGPPASGVGTYGPPQERFRIHGNVLRGPERFPGRLELGIRPLEYLAIRHLAHHHGSPVGPRDVDAVTHSRLVFLEEHGDQQRRAFVAPLKRFS